MLTTARALVDKAANTADIYCAAAVYSIAEQDQQQRLQGIMLKPRRHLLQLARWEHTPASVLQLLVDTVNHEDKAQGSSIAVRLDKNANTPALALSQLYAKANQAGEKQAALTLLIAQHAHTPLAVLEQIVGLGDAQEHEAAEILKAVSKNPAANPVLLERLLTKTATTASYALLLKNVAANPAASASLLSMIYAQGDAYSRAAAVAHINCSPALLKKALTDAEPLVLRQIAADARLSAQALTSLVQSEDAAVRCGVAANPQTPPALMKRLAQDSSARVRRVVATRADLSRRSYAYLSHDSDDWVRQRLARNASLSRKLLYQLATDDHADVRRAVARNSHCPSKLLKVLAADIKPWVRAAVAYQPRAKKGLLELLATDSDIDVLSGAANNQHTPQRLLKQLACSLEEDIRRSVICNPNAKRSTLIPLLQDGYYLHRLLLVNNPRLHDRDKWPLCADPDYQVRFMAFSYFARVLAKTELTNKKQANKKLTIKPARSSKKKGQK
jgi:hypothetical protein